MMRWRVPPLITAIISCLVVVLGEGFLRRAMAVVSCGIFTVHAAACTAPINTSGLRNSTVPSGQLPIEQSEVVAFQLPKVPGGKAVNDLAWGYVATQLMKVLGDDAPIVSNQQKLYPTINVLPSALTDGAEAGSASSSTETVSTQAPQKTQYVGRLPGVRRQNRPETGSVALPSSLIISDGNMPFTPTGDVSDIIQQLRSSKDGTVRLAPGDYEIPVRLFCMKQRASSPPGHRYLLAPLKGSRADVIAMLNARAAGHKIEYQPFQVLSWNIQAGMAYDDMPPASKALVDQFIPDYRGRLSRGLLEQVESTYNSLRGVGNLPAFNSALSQLGAVGQLVQEYRQFQDTLQRYSNNYDQLFATLIPQGQSNSRGGKESTPWSKLNNQTYARLVAPGSAGSTGTLSIRVLPSDSGTPVTVPLGSTIADSQNGNIQSLTGVVEEDKSPKPSRMCSAFKLVREYRDRNSWKDWRTYLSYLTGFFGLNDASEIVTGLVAGNLIDCPEASGYDVDELQNIINGLSTAAVMAIEDKAGKAACEAIRNSGLADRPDRPRANKKELVGYLGKHALYAACGAANTTERPNISDNSNRDNARLPHENKRVNLPISGYPTAGDLFNTPGRIPRNPQELNDAAGGSPPWDESQPVYEIIIPTGTPLGRSWDGRPETAREDGNFWVPLDEIDGQSIEEIRKKTAVLPEWNSMEHMSIGTTKQPVRALIGKANSQVGYSGGATQIQILDNVTKTLGLKNIF